MVGGFRVINKIFVVVASYLIYAVIYTSFIVSKITKCLIYSFSLIGLLRLRYWHATKR